MLGMKLQLKFAPGRNIKNTSDYRYGGMEGVTYKCMYMYGE